MDYSSEERFSVAVLGEPDNGHVRGTVHGGRGDMWGRHFYQICCKLCKNMVITCTVTVPCFIPAPAPYSSRSVGFVTSCDSMKF